VPLRLGPAGYSVAKSGVRQRARKPATAQTRPMPTRPAAFEHKLAGLTSSLCVVTSPQVENRDLECGRSNSCRGTYVLTYPAVPRDHEPRTAPWRIREQSTGRPPRRGLEHSYFKALRRQRRARRCTVCGLPAAAPAGTACHVGTAQLREATVRSPSSVARAFGTHLQRP
jgi:hypothetical protein